MLDIHFPRPVPLVFKEDLERQIFYLAEEIDDFRLILGPRGVDGVRLRLEGSERPLPEHVRTRLLTVGEHLRGQRRRQASERLWTSSVEPPATIEGEGGTFERLCARGMAFQVANGLVAIDGRVMALVDHLDARITQRVKQEMAAVEYRYPTLIPSRVMRRGGYLESFPQLMMFVTRLHSDDLLTTEPVGDTYHRYCHDTDLCLPPTMCYHTFHQLADSELSADPGRAITARGRSFRFESKYEHNLERLWDFTIREVVFLGSARFVREQRRRLMEIAFELVEAWGLAGHCETANDPFFAPADGGDEQFLQRLMALKYELRLGIDGGATLAAASFNLHNDFFGGAFGIRSNGGSTAQTACAGFGLERLAFAFLCQHGLDPRGWPREVAAAVAAEGMS